MGQYPRIAQNSRPADGLLENTEAAVRTMATFATAATIAVRYSDGDNHLQLLVPIDGLFE